MDDRGTAPRSLIFLPGAGGDPDFWRPLGEQLPADWRKTYLSWPGLGNQQSVPGVRGFGDFVTLAEAALEDGPVDLLGQSMGGAIALQVALNNPGRVRRLVLTATSGGLDVTALGAADWRTEYAREFPAVDLRWFEGWPDLEAQLPAVSQPVLLLWSDADPISPLAVGRRLAELVPNARLEVVPGGSHAFANELPGSIREAILHHLV